MKKKIWRLLGIVVIVGVVVFAAIQLIRPGVIHHNPFKGRFLSGHMG